MPGVLIDRKPARVEATARGLQITLPDENVKRVDFLP
jgi:hypothetical protein